MKDLAATAGRRLLQEWISQGEHTTQDFKFSVSDPRKIARSLSAFANNQGGRLLLGVKDNGVVAGVRNEEDIYVIELAATRYCRPSQDVQFKAYSVDAKLRVIVASIKASDERPVKVVEADGIERAYYRVYDENIVAHPLMVRAWELNSRSSGISASMGGFESELLSYLVPHSTTGLSPSEIALGLHCSLQRVEDTIVRLASLSLVRFIFDGTSFRIAPAE